MKELTIIGATGKLAIPVINELLEKGVAIKAVVRDVAGAREKLPPTVDIVFGDLENVASLEVALQGTEYLYLNLRAPIPDEKFVAELHGVQNILKAVKGKLKQIIKIADLGTLHPEFHPSKTRHVGSVLRQQGHSLIKAAGIPLTTFNATWFINAIPWFIQGKSLIILGKHKAPMYWTNTIDLANYIFKAIGNKDTFDKDFALQGKEPLLYIDAAQKYVSAKNLPLQVVEAPVPEDALGFLGDVLRYSESFEEKFQAQELYEVLGEPALSFTEAVEAV
ncbi:SDR family oxidoreductase [uncultured Microscilla sp.]|uniref:SDR family oxidoreductase n=1 Tax=uncultured Microscilla sp. TaxID=432653 RepID=UPI00261FCF5E|nr:SDR family oxidoreductase [uncultured Microscilla sp.]